MVATVTKLFFFLKKDRKKNKNMLSDERDESLLLDENIAPSEFVYVLYETRGVFIALMLAKSS